MIKRQLDPGREAWQKPAEVVRRLGIRRGEVVAEIGCGPGYFTGRLARAVGPSGRVFAVDAEPMILETLRDRLDGIRNVTPVLGRGDDPLLQQGSCDLALVVNVYHHFGDRATALRHIARTLNSRGRLVNIDWDARETPVGPPLKRRIPRDDFLRDARRAGLTLVAEHQCLPYQYFLVLRRTGRRENGAAGPSYFRRGSRASRSPSPKRLKPSTVTKMARPGKSESQK
jgi:ubiquinone/menaquinone biosynthesis C-methylase UbiE